MDANLLKVYEQVMQADHPEDLFSSFDIVLPVDTLLAYLQEKYDKMRAVTDPTVYQDLEDVEAATDANKKLSRLYAAAQERIRQHIYGLVGRGKPRPHFASKSFAVGPNRYYVGHELAKGERSIVYEGYLERGGESVGEVVIKVAANAAQNHFSLNEARAIDLLHRDPVPQWKHLPFLMDRFNAGDRVGLIFRKISGVSLMHVRQHRAHRDGLDQRHVAWMLDRLLSCLGYVHRCGLVHGNLTLDHIIVEPQTHNALITGWSASVHKPAVTGEKVALFSKAFSAPEVQARGMIGPWSDLYSIGKIMISLLAGDPTDNTIPDGVEPLVHDFLLKLVQEDPYKRPADAWEMYAENCRIKDALWPRKFLHLDLA